MNLARNTLHLSAVLSAVPVKPLPALSLYPVNPSRLSLLPVAPSNAYLLRQCTPVNRVCVCVCVLHIGDLVCDDYWDDFQSSWSWGPTGSQRGAGTRITTTSCFLCWMTRSPATSCTAWTPRMPWATNGSSSHGLLTSLRCNLRNVT